MVALASQSNHESILLKEYTPFDRLRVTAFIQSLRDIGERYYTYRKELLLKLDLGLTKLYNRFHKKDDTDPEIVKLRALHVEMDIAVRDAYGWLELPLDHGFHETKQGERYTISEAARREILDRLLTLNHERGMQERSLFSIL